MLETFGQLLQTLPFEWVQYKFMQNAFLAVLLVSPLFGLLGTMVVNNRMAFFSDAIGHSALTGIALGVLFGLREPLTAMIGFSILLAIGINFVLQSSSSSTDTIIGVFSSSAVALGIVILSRNGGFSKYSQFLIGDLLSISPTEITLLVIALAAVLIYWLFCFNQLLMVSVNASLASSRGSRASLITFGFSMLVAVIVTLSIQWVGLLIINSLLILPAAAARNLSETMWKYNLWSVLIALFSGVVGLILSYYWGTATGATIVLCAAVIFLLSLLPRKQRV